MNILFCRFVLVILIGLRMHYEEFYNSLLKILGDLRKLQFRTI